MTQLYIYIPFRVLFHYGLSQDVEYSSPCYTVSEVKVSQLCPTVCDPMDHTVCGILQATILEWVGFPFSRGSSQPRDGTQQILYQLSHQGNPRILEWVAYPFFSRSSRSRN